MNTLNNFLKKIQYLLPFSYPAEIKKLIPKGATVLDVGCGDGYLMSWVNSKNEFKVVGIDINRADLKLAKKRICIFGNERPVYEKLVFGDLSKKIPFNKKFDVVLSSQVVEHLEKEKALELIKKIEKLAKKRVIVATINGFFQFDHRVAGKHDVHLSGWSAKEFSGLGYKVSGHGLKFIYMPGALKDILPSFFHPFLFLISYLATPILKVIYFPSLLLVTYKDK